MPQDHVPATLPIQAVPELAQCTDELAPRENRQLGQFSISTISSEIAGGIGSPCASRLSR